MTSKANLSKVGLESSKFELDNLFTTMQKKPEHLHSIEIYHTDKSIVGIFPDYSGNGVPSDESYKKYLDRLGENLSKDKFIFEKDEFLENILTYVNNKEGSNQSEIYGIALNTNKKSSCYGKILSDELLQSNETAIHKLEIVGQHIIGLRTTYENKSNSKFPNLTFMKIYTTDYPNNIYTSIRRKIFSFFDFTTHLITFILLLIAFLLSYYFFSQNIYKGVLILEADSHGLHYPTKLHTDEHGFIHIKAEIDEDAFFTIGIAQARDRLWQMDMLRRLARGKLSEVLGEKAIRLDKTMRNIGINRLVEKDTHKMLSDSSSSEIVRKLSRFIDAVNFYANKNYLPPEYQILGVKFENWTISDSIAVSRLITFTVTFDYQIELFNNIIETHLGKEFSKLVLDVAHTGFLHSNKTVVSEEELRKLNLDVGSGGGSVSDRGVRVPTSNYFKSESENELLITNSNTIDDNISTNSITNSDFINAHASNSWVVSANLTSTGKPILTNDPHLNNCIPSMHYIVKLYIGNSTHLRTFVGNTIPGIPIIISGNNNFLAWGITTDNRDNSDICEEILDNDDIGLSKYYFVGSTKKKLQVYEEEIKIKGMNSVNFTFKSTERGPIIEEFIKELNFLGKNYKYSKKKNSNANPISLRVNSFEFEPPIKFIYNLMLSKSKEDFLPYLDEYGGALLALTWATSTEIGYTPIGKIPLKENKLSIMCKGHLEPSESADFISGYIPRNETPVLINPEKGFIVTANNRQLPESYIHYTQSYAYFNRFYRITDLIQNIIQENRKFEVADSISILSDDKDIYCENILPKYISIIERNFDLLLEEKKEKLEVYLNLLKSFDCHMHKNSTLATLYSVFEYNLGKYLLVQNKENGVTKGFETADEANGVLNSFNYWNFIWDMTDRIYNKLEYPDLQNCKYYKSFSTCEGYILLTFEHIHEFLTKDYYRYINENDEILTWGEVHFNYYPHTFDSNNLLKKVFSRKIPTDGNRNTIKVSKSKYTDIINGPFTSTHSANMKIINDFSDITRPYIVIDTGNSGNVLNKFYDNLIGRSQNNELIKIKDHLFNDDVHLLISFPEHNTIIIRNK